MLPRVTDVRHTKDYELNLYFSDGTIALLDFRTRVTGRGGVFRPLENIDFFSQVKVDAEAGTIVWPNGVDFCPDVLYAQAMGRTIDSLTSQAAVSNS
jgi:hypothetical protein